MKLAIDLHQRRINTKVLDQMVGRKDITVQEKSYIIEAAAEMSKREQLQPVQAEPVISLDLFMKRNMLNPEDQNIVDSLPEILGFKFCPRLGTDSGLLAPLEGDFVTPEYEAAYLMLIDAILEKAKMILSSEQNFNRIMEDEFLASIAKNYDDNDMAYIYAALPAGLNKDKTDLNPVFPRNFWLNILGLRLDDSSPNSVLKIKKHEMLPLIESRQREAKNAISIVMKTLEELAAQEAEALPSTEVSDLPEIDLDVEQTTDVAVIPESTELLPPVESIVPNPITPFYKKRSNQAVAVALVAVAGYYLMRKK